MNLENLVIVAPQVSRSFGEKICRHLGVSLGDLEEREFPDGEHKSRALVSVREKDVFVVCSLHGEHGHSVNDKLCRLLFLLGSLRDASAGRITAVVPYLCYARKDRKSKPRDPVMTRYVAQLFEAVGIDRLVTLDVHNLAAFQNAFRIPTEHLQAKSLFIPHLAARFQQAAITVVSPDEGGVKRAEAFRAAFERVLGRPVGSAFMEKYRSAGVLSGSTLVGDVKGRIAILIDDLISSGGTLARAAVACRDAGASSVHAVATHGLFNANAGSTLAGSPLASIVVTDAVPTLDLPADFPRDRLVTLEAAPLFAEAIRGLHLGQSIGCLDEI
jgi:ribose-phosphate pyrophosphokinase